MSTFGGWMPEFPEIRVDYFRHIEGVRPPLACFLSHVHSDHLAGLESLKAPFVYCTVATKELLLRLERYPHRINFDLEILESRKQHYRHLKNLLKPIPLETPTRIELAPGNEIQVTLFDANHCTGACMFLMEGNGRTILYTGDIRSEPWFVNNLARNPILIEYVSNFKKIDCIYLDTSFTDDVAFPTKAEGLEELLRKISKYPKDTIFHFAAWTFGYEEVWIALSRALNSQVHVDSYKMRLYQSLRGDSSKTGRHSGPFIAHEGPALTGFKVGNNHQPGILTLDGNVRLHSCEKGARCSHLDEKTVWIRPIIARTPSGQEISEMGVGGGGGDLTQRPELDLGNDWVIDALMSKFDTKDFSVQNHIRAILIAGFRTARKVLFLDVDRIPDELPLEEFANLLARSVLQKLSPIKDNLIQAGEFPLPTIITFPYSRHSSYAELRALVKIFKPRDIYPCTVDKAHWDEAVSVRLLFGDLCSGGVFRHDDEIRRRIIISDHEDTEKSQTTCSSHSTQDIDSQENTEAEGESRNSPLGKEAWKVDDRLLGQPGVMVAVPVESELDVVKPASTATPDSSPGSDVDNLRRKASSETGTTRDQKRVCLQEENDKLRSEDYVDDVETTGQNGALIRGRDSLPGVSYYDAEDDVYRCVICNWEFWRPSGECSGCGAGLFTSDQSVAYENVGSSQLPAHQSSLASSKENKDEFDKEVEQAGRYFDERSSAYDSASEREDIGYEVNSFINDSPESDHKKEIEDTDDFISDAEIDYKKLHQQVLLACNDLEQENDKLIDDNTILRRGILGSDYEESDETFVEAVDGEVDDPPLSELILSQVQGDSQASVISPERMRTRVDAFLAVSDNDDWRSISLISTGGNHTEAEVEL